MLTSQRVTDVVLKAFNAAAASQVRCGKRGAGWPGQAVGGLWSRVGCGMLHSCLAWLLAVPPLLPFRLPAGCRTHLPAHPHTRLPQGCMNNFTFGDEGMGYYETIAGGAGAGPGWHGRSGVHTHMTNTRITDPGAGLYGGHGVWGSMRRVLLLVLHQWVLVQGRAGRVPARIVLTDRPSRLFPLSPRDSGEEVPGGAAPVPPASGCVGCGGAGEAIVL